jgi:tyrosyl-DNA phosphodiesterase 2
MDVVSWNLNGLEDVDLGPRTEGAMFTLLLGGLLEDVLEGGPKVSPPAVVLLQEVVEQSFYAHVAPHLKAAGYTLFPETPPERGYFEVIAVRGPVLSSSTRRFAVTGMGRCLTAVQLPYCTVFTAHLESLGPGRPARVAQVSEVLHAMASVEGPALFGGDTNLRKAEWESLTVPEGIVDAWEALGSRRATHGTWQHARYDRFWLKGMVPASFTLIGKKPLPATGTPPSDHLGIRLSLA